MTAPTILVLPVPGALRVTIDGRSVDLPRSREDLNYHAHLSLKAAMETPCDCKRESHDQAPS